MCMDVTTQQIVAASVLMISAGVSMAVGLGGMYAIVQWADRTWGQ